MDVTDDVRGHVKFKMSEVNEIGEQYIYFKSKQRQLTGIDSATDTCKNQYLPVPCDQNTGQGHLKTSGQMVKPKNLREMTFFDKTKSVKN